LSTHSPKRFRKFCITRCSMLGEIAATSSLMFCFKSTVILGFFTYTLLLRYPQRKKYHDYGHAKGSTHSCVAKSSGISAGPYRSPNKMHMLQSLFYLMTALHVSGIIITHLQEHKTTVTTASGNPLHRMLSVAIVEEVQMFHCSNRKQYGLTFKNIASHI